MWSNVVEETGEPGENHRTWTGDHYPGTGRGIEVPELGVHLK